MIVVPGTKERRVRKAKPESLHQSLTKVRGKLGIWVTVQKLLQEVQAKWTGPSSTPHWCGRAVGVQLQQVMGINIVSPNQAHP